MQTAKSTIEHEQKRSDITILIADHDEINRSIVTEMLELKGYNVVAVSDGEQALIEFEHHNPHVVVLGVMLPVHSGYEVARVIKESRLDEFIPILFLTPLLDTLSMNKCLQAGGVDIISKPLDRTIFTTKINNYVELSVIYRTSQEQKARLEKYHNELEANHLIAKKVFSGVMQSDVLKSSAIKYSLSPISVFNGDVLLAANKPTGELHVILGDFTGHGLGAAIGAIPVSEIFYGMTDKGFSIEDIAREINGKLQRVLPRGLFLAVCMFEYSSESKKITVYNGGIPDLIIYNKKTNIIKEKLASKNFPFGVSSEIGGTNCLDFCELEEDDHIVLYTDGIAEAKNSTSELFGLDRVYESILTGNSEWVLDDVLNDVEIFCGGVEQTDDTTIVEIDVNKIVQTLEEKSKINYPEPLLNSTWEMTFNFDSGILKVSDPLPKVIQTILEVQQLQKYKQNIFITIKELFTNALEHGLLNLDSNIKKGINGFSNYILQRQEQLAKLHSGTVTLQLLHSPSKDGGNLDIFVRDTGNGFDVEGLETSLSDSAKYHGRGLFMVKNICEFVKFNESGNQVHARFVWPPRTN